MKRFFSALLCAVLMLAMPGPAVSAADTGFSLGEADSFTMTATADSDKDAANQVDTASKAHIAALRELLAAAGSAVSGPTGLEQRAVIKVTAAGKTTTYNLYWADRSYYIQRGAAYRPLEYGKFEAFAGTVGFYKYNKVPSATVTIGGEKKTLAVHSQQYSYRGLSHNYYRLKTGAGTPPVDTSGKLLALSFELKPDSVSYVVMDESGHTLWSGSGAETAKYTPADTAALVRVTAGYDNRQYKGQVTYEYEIRAAQPVTVTVQGSDTYPGEIVVIKVTGRDASGSLPKATASSDVDFKPQFFYQDQYTQIALLPVSVYTGVGQHWVDVTCGQYSSRVTFNAAKKEFEVQNLTVAASTAEQTILSQKANAEYEQVIGPLRTVSDNTQHWNGRFILPCSDQKVPSPLGIIRYTNGSATASRHNALDLAVPQGTEVKATGAGRVLYAGFLQLTGNTVLIEHGFGLKSWYYHMDSLSVKTGDMVSQARVVGKVGSTGFSTGPHLHFGMSVNNVFINPYTLINTDLLAKDSFVAARITLTLERDSYPLDTKTIKGTVANNTSKENGYGKYYKIERYENAAWTKIPLEFDVEDIGIILPPGNVGSVSFNLYQDQHVYKAGRYRITMTDAPGGLSAEFTLQ